MDLPCRSGTASSNGGDAMSDTYDAVYTRCLNHPENFWAEAAEAVDWHKKGEMIWGQVLQSHIVVVKRRDNQLTYSP